MKKFLMLALFVGSFSLMGANYADAAGCHCQAPAVAATQPAAPAATAQGSTAVRRYSYDSSVAPRAVYTPMRRMEPSRTPSYLLPKSDPRKFSVN